MAKYVLNMIALLSLAGKSSAACPFSRMLRANVDDVKLEQQSTLFDEETSRFRPPNNPPPNNPPPNNPPPNNPGNPPENLPGPVCAKNGGLAAVTDSNNICSTYNSVKNAFQSILPVDRRDRANLFGAVVRLAFHDAGEIDIRTNDNYGPDGCLSDSSDNAGLIEGNEEVAAILEPIWQEHCDVISRADFWVMFARLALQEAASVKPMIIPYHYGRKDNTVCNDFSGRLPDAQFGLDVITEVFVNQMGLTIDDAVTLIGAHTLGHVSPQNSGFGVSNPQRINFNTNGWDNTPDVFDNNYFVTLLNDVWRQDSLPNGHSMYQRGRTSVMLDTDMSLAFEIGADLDGIGIPGPCGGAARCGPVPNTRTLVERYANSNALFHSDFATSFSKMTNVGYGIVEEGSEGKLGLLNYVDLETCPA